MSFYLDASESETTGTATLCLGNEPGGQLVATLPYKTDRDKERARMFAQAPDLYAEIEGIRGLWWYIGPLHHQCPQCKAKITIPCASDAQIGRLERLRMMRMED